MASKKPLVNFFYDLVSPYSFLGFEQITRYSRIWPINLKLKPVFLAAVVKNSKQQPQFLVPAKAVHMVRDVELVSKCYNVPIKIPSNFYDMLMNTKYITSQLRFLTAIDQLSHHRFTESVSRQFYNAIFNRHIPLDQLDYKQLARDSGVKDDVIDEALLIFQNDQIRNRLRETTDQAIKCGAFGCPWTEITKTNGSTETFFGSDRMEVMANTLGLKYDGPLSDKSESAKL